MFFRSRWQRLAVPKASRLIRRASWFLEKSCQASRTATLWPWLAFRLFRQGLTSIVTTSPHLAMGQHPVPPVNIPIPLKKVLKWVVRLPQNGTIGFDPQPRNRVATDAPHFAQNLQPILSVASVTEAPFPERSPRRPSGCRLHLKISQARQARSGRPVWPTWPTQTMIPTTRHIGEKGSGDFAVTWNLDSCRVLRSDE